AVGAGLDRVEQMTYTGFRSQLSASTCVVCLDVDRDPLPAVIGLSPTLAFPILELLLGAQPDGTVKPEREITEVEQTVLEDVFTLFLSQVAELWSTPEPLKMRIGSMHNNPERAEALDSSETVIAFVANLRI